MPAKIYHRKNNRYKDYDYSSDGFYFVTVCTQNHKHLFGDIENNRMVLNRYGKIAEKYWVGLPGHYTNCTLDEFVIMPNHVHGIIIIDNGRRERSLTVPRSSLGKNLENAWNGQRPFPTKYGLPEIIRGFKAFSSLEINAIDENADFHWQKSFYDHVISDENALYKIREYILNNPPKWDSDKNHIANICELE